MTATLLAMDRVAMVARKTENPRLADAIATARATLEEATDRTRRLMFELRPAILHERGLRPALELLADQTAREADAKARVECRVGRYERAVEELVYRTVQEALANVRKHARPRRISVKLAEDGDRLAGEVRDDGRGFDVEAARMRPDAALHLGLDALTERVRAVGGEASISSAPGEGTRVAFAVPLRRQLRPSA
jgi:signal transduction histidine kinase